MNRTAFDSGYRTWQELEARDRGTLESVRPQDTPQAVCAFWEYVTTQHPSEPRALSKGSGAAGLYAVPTELADEIIAIARAKGTISRFAHEFPTNTGRAFNVPTTTAHGSSAWIAENGSYATSDETFGNVPLGAYKAGTLVVISDELMADSGPDLEEYLTEEFGGRIAALEGDAFVNGDGSGKPTGFLANINSVQAPTGNTASIRYADLITALHTVPVGYREPIPTATDGTQANLGEWPSWLVSDGALALIQDLRDTGGTRVLTERTATSPYFLLGYPLYVEPFMPAPAANAKSVAFGAWRYAYAIRRTGTFGVLRLNEIYASNGQVGLRGAHRVDGKVVIANAACALQHSST